MKKFITLFFSLIISSSTFTQLWVKMMEDPNANFYDIQKEFNKFWETPGRKVILDKMKLVQKGEATLTDHEKSLTAGWKQFKRWEWLKEQRVYPSGNLLPPPDFFEAIEQKKSETVLAGNWTYIGPHNVPTNGGGAGRVNCVRFDPANPNIVYAGTPAGGVWKSTNGGSGWTMWNTDGLSSLGVSDIAIDPTNSQIIYIGSGDANGSDTYGIGVLKSTDGGLTWNTTGLNWAVTQGRTVRRLLIDPTNPQIIHAGTSSGIYRSTDGGATFTQVLTTPIRNMEFKPGDPTVIYASSSTTVYRSTNSGQSYVSVYSISGSGRLALAVTQANANYLYVLSASSSSSAFHGLYRSTDGGGTFSQRSNTPNILGYANDGSDASGQGWYDLCIAASPSDAEEIVIGGINIWRSVNGGSNWSIIAHWTGSGAPYVHADIHDIIYLNSTTIYVGCDGGVFRTQNSGLSWSDLSNGLHIGQSYRIGQSANNATWLLTGRQDNGTDRLNGTTWSRVIGGDGMECFIDRTNNNIMYGELYYGDFRRSINGGSSWSSIQSGLSGSAAWVTPWQQDPISANTLWAGYSQIFKSTNQGNSWTQMGTINGTGTFRAIKVAPSNNQVIYASRTTSIYKSTDGGNTWTSISAGLPVSSASITYIEVNPTDPNHVWVTFSGYSSGNKVFVSVNGGGTWTNYSTGLPNLPVNCIVYENGSANGTLYVGTDVGAYYRDNTMSAWANFSSGLPNVIVNELEIMYPVGKIRAATYGRGIWESPLYSPVSVSEHLECLKECLTVYPNPNQGIFVISSTDDFSEAKFEIFNSLGEKIHAENVLVFPYTVDVRRFGKGIYLLLMRNGTTILRKKVTIM